MYVNYYVFEDGAGKAYLDLFPSKIILGSSKYRPHRPSECVWMVPGTVDSLED